MNTDDKKTFFCPSLLAYPLPMLLSYLSICLTQASVLLRYLSYHDTCHTYLSVLHRYLSYPGISPAQAIVLPRYFSYICRYSSMISVQSLVSDDWPTLHNPVSSGAGIVQRRGCLIRFVRLPLPNLRYKNIEIV